MRRLADEASGQRAMVRGARASMVLACWLGFLAVAAFPPPLWSQTAEAKGEENGIKTSDSERPTRREIEALTLLLIQAEALNEELLAEKEMVKASARQDATSSRQLEAKDALWEKLFSPESATATRPLLEARGAFHREHEALAKRVWRAALKREQEFASIREAGEARIGRAVGSPDTDARRRPLWIPLGLGVLAVGGGLLLTLHEGRNRLRWRARAMASRPTVLALAIGLALVSVGPAHAVEGPGELELERDRLRAKLAEVESANRAELAELRRLQSELRQERAVLGLVPRTPLAKRRAFEAVRAAEEMQERFREVRVSARITARLTAEAERIEADVKRGHEALAKAIANDVATARREGLTKLALCSALAAVALTPLSIIRRAQRRRLEQDRRLCPRCLSKDTLQAVEVATVELAGGFRQPKARLVICDACEYEIRENYVRQNRLCFPTVGVRSSGKTHWLLNVYDQIKNKDHAVNSVIKKIASRGDRRFDELVEAIKYELIRPDGTLFTTLPEPLTFHVQDADPLGRNRTMVNMFDFSGEMTNFSIDGETNPEMFRRRALLCEGFTLFLDPTQVLRTSKGSIDSQINCLQQFAEELHAMRGIPSEKPVDLPIAVCVSKIDLLVGLNPMATEAIDLVAELRRSLGQPIRLDLIQRRSQLIARAMPRIFPGWGLERDLREGFGGRFMFFPMSAVGLEEMELGNDNLAERQITPFGMLEPLLWLLHMHGYCVLR